MKLQGGTVHGIWVRDKGICHLCGCKVPLEQASRDHVETAVAGGYSKGDNYRLAHRKCNTARGDLPVDLAYAAIAELGLRLQAAREAGKPKSTMSPLRAQQALRMALKVWRATNHIRYGPEYRQVTIERRVAAERGRFRGKGVS